MKKKINDICSNETFNKVVYKSLTGLEKYYIHNKIHQIRVGLFPLKYKYKYINIKDCTFINFLMTENITFSNNEGSAIYEEYKNKDSIIFLDPPYLLADNSCYKNPALKIYEYLHDNKMKNEKATIIVSVEYNFLIRLIFKKYIFHMYDKGNIKNKRQNKQHLIICNNKLK